MLEIYKDIEGYEGLYQVSNKGNVKALDRYNIDKNGKKKFYPGKLLSFDINSCNHTDYYRVSLSRDGKTKRFQVHRLVAMMFLPQVENKPYINHKDNNGTNNIVQNLEWCTHSENMLHAQKQGRLFATQSKAGKIAGESLRKAAILKITAAIGTTVNGYRIISYKGYIKTRHMVKAECLRCGSTTQLAYRHITRGKNTRCKDCKNVKDKNLASWKVKQGI